MPNMHPLLTHFPIVLLTASFVFDAMSVLWRRVEYERLGAWAQLIGTASLAATIASGLAAKGALRISEGAMDTIHIHEQIAFLAAVLTSGLLLWRIAARLSLPARHRNVYLALSFATMVLVWGGAWYGGELVYRFGVGVREIGGVQVLVLP